MLKSYSNHKGVKSHRSQNVQPRTLTLKDNHFNNIFSGTVIFLSCFLLSFVAGSLIIQPQGTKAVTGLTLVTTPEITLSSSGDVAVEITPSSTGVISAGSHTLTASTNVPTGYSLTLSTADTPSLTTTGGTLTTPTVLANNTWGYAIAGAGGFDAAYTAPSPSTTSTWADPTDGETIKDTSNSSTNDTTTVYYAAKADATLPSGTYDNTVRYTATANIADISTPSITSVTPSSGTIAGGTAIEIVGTGFTMNDQSVTTAVTIDGAACQNVTISSNTPTTGQDTIYCTTPAHALGTVDVAATTWGGEATLADGFRYKNPAVAMQNITMENCTTERTLAYDARDNRTYWVQKMADGRCWMLTNLAYAGGGTDTYGDVKTISNGEAVAPSYTDAYYYVPTDANPTDNPTDPSTSTDGGATNPQYGYLYNWCAAMGAQTGTTACSDTSTTADADTSISICPSGWRLPTGDGGSPTNEFQDLNNAENSGSTSSPAGLLSSWLGQYSGDWNGSFTGQGSNGARWSSTQDTAIYAQSLSYNASLVAPGTGSNNKYRGRAVRCILDIPVMQEMTIDECTSTRTMVYDARDKRTYWVQRTADGKCWMETNLAYAGDGDNTYGDTKTISNGESVTTSYTDAYYYVPTGANPTDYPTTPSTSTDSGATNPQYGYLYNWCAAMGAQTSTSACANAETPAPDTSISICPSGWRLPTGSGGSPANEFEYLNNAVNSSSTSSSAGLLSSWLGQYAGRWDDGFYDTGGIGRYWSSTQANATSVRYLYFTSSVVSPGVYYDSKSSGRAVRCVMDEAKTGDDIQTVSIDNCPVTRTRVRDARDDATYWVQRMADGKCWMLTNLAYGGGGTNTYGDVKAITDDTTGTATTYTQANYYIPTDANKTTGTTDPSTSTDGGATNPQYGYLYNWCAAMGAQTSTSACADTETPAPDTSISICPSGWRLPTSNTDGEFQQLTDTIGATTNGVSNGSAGNTNLKNEWLAMHSGYWFSGFNGQGSGGHYWSSTQNSATAGYFLDFGIVNVTPSNSGNKQGGRAVRCVAI